MAQVDTTSCTADTPLDGLRSIIDRNIASLEESIRALKSRRNELAPISRLPVEILCHIFSLTEDLLSRTRRPESWTNFSQASRHWRTSALSAPDLWTNIPLNYPRWAEEMLKRSKTATLTIRSGLSIETSNPKTIETVRSCLCEMNRVEEINLSAIPVLILEEIFRDLPKSAPQLHTMCIQSQSLSPGTTFSIHEDFLYDTERLRRVELINCKIGWDSKFLTGLTRLTLEDSLKTNSSIIEVFHALQRMPALTDLRLKDSIPDNSEGPSTYPVVDLPYLRVLNISSGVGPMTAVLRHINFPPSAILNLTCNEKQSAQIDFSKFLSVLATKVLSTLVIRRLRLKALSDYDSGSGLDGLKFYLWTTELIQDCLPIRLFSQSQLQLVLTWPSSQLQNYVKVFTCVFDAMNLSFLTQLHITTWDYIDSQTWVKTFGRLPLLEGVCVHNDTQNPFFKALVHKTKAAEESKTAYLDLSFPNLRYIHLERTTFSLVSSGGTSVDILLDCLMERCERNAEVQVLRLDDCYSIYSCDVERLKEIVVDVIWDGVEQEDEEEQCSEC